MNRIVGKESKWKTFVLVWRHVNWNRWFAERIWDDAQGKRPLGTSGIWSQGEQFQAEDGCGGEE